jgi:hypothetical protein
MKSCDLKKNSGMDFKEARDLVISAFKEAGGCNYEGDNVLVVGTNSRSIEVHIRESGSAIEMFSKLNGVEGSSFFKHIKLAYMTAEQAKEAGRSIASFCFNTLEKENSNAQ